MRILRIAGRNLASLAGDFEVDFRSGQLATAGLFAISGPTGAGKSTLLDALCLALYDATPRLLKINKGVTLPDVGEETVSVQDPRALLRRGCAEGFAEVDFEAGSGSCYRARWSVRRSRTRATGKLQPSEITLHSLPDLARIGRTNTETLAEISQRVGLNFEQFTRSVLLAQNEFSAFLKTEENERGELLETLTGSTVYSTLSRRAYDRFRAEQARLQLVTARLADQVPMPAEERAAMEVASAAADAALAALEPKKAALEALLRWFEDEARLRAGLAAAETDAAAAEAGHAASQPRRAQLASIDSVQDARPLVQEVDRLAALQSTSAAMIQSASDAAARSTEAHSAARGRADAAAAALQAARGNAADAQPLIDRAKALDAQLAALSEPHADAATRHAALGADLADQDSRRVEMESARKQLAGNQASLAAWLDRHAGAGPLAQQWERWQALLARASATVASLAQHAAALAQEEIRRNAAQQALMAAEVELEAAGKQASAAQAARDTAAAQLRKHDIDALHSARAALEQRRNGLVSASAAWQAWESARTGRLDAGNRLADLQTAAATQQAALATMQLALPPLEAAHAQARHSLSLARLACADSVESLRSQLEDGHPCPVCGSADHPYVARDPALHALLDQLEREAAATGARVDAERANIAALRERVAATHAQAEATAAALAELTARETAAQSHWNAHPGYRDGACADDFTQAGQTLDAETAALVQREQSLHAALTARDTAQAALDNAMRAREAAQSAHTRAAGEAGAAQSSVDVCIRDSQAQSRALEDCLEELDGPLSKISNVMIEEFEHGWRQAWRGDPPRIERQLDRLVEDWRSNSASHASGHQLLLEMDARLATAAATRDRTAADLVGAGAELAKLDTALAALRTQRAGLFDGRAIVEVEQEFAARVQAASDQHQAMTAAASQASEQLALASAALAQAESNASATTDALLAARADLQQWLQAKPGMQEAGLRALLAHTNDWIRTERAALDATTQTLLAAQAVLRERREQHQRHLATAPLTEGQTDAGTREALAALVAERDAAAAQAASLQRALDQDNARRQAASKLREELERQQQEERRWARMNELIGSADGKKFRNYAQQFTLDVLLGYANAHLQHLARRYRLERVASATGPSLGLMVRDQDMGGEIRSVNSLSGGESFLVSLALALGLASLSSNRVKVESLFIDEGFGSLDSETLRVAMDALDGLQATGRRVGVISHVHEMTERIAVRILVQPAGGGSSTVTVG